MVRYTVCVVIGSSSMSGPEKQKWEIRKGGGNSEYSDISLAEGLWVCG